MNIYRDVFSVLQGVKTQISISDIKSTGTVMITVRNFVLGDVEVKEGYCYSVFGDSFKIFKTEFGRGYRVDVFCDDSLVAIVDFDSLEDCRDDKTFGGDLVVYSEDPVMRDDPESIPVSPFPVECLRTK